MKKGYSYVEKNDGHFDGLYARSDHGGPERFAVLRGFRRGCESAGARLSKAQPRADQREERAGPGRLQNEGRPHGEVCKLLRSGKPTDLSKADRKKLVHQYKLKKVIDFRDRAEILIDGEDTKLPGVTYYNFSYSMTPVNSWLRSTAGLDHLSYQLETLIAQDFDGNLISAYYGVGYRSMYLTEDGIALFRNFFRELLDANGDTVLFHCSSGKDRAGNAAMLLLSALGVDKKTIIEDYMLTNDYFAEDRKELYDVACRIVPDKSIAKDISYLLGVRRSYIENSYRSIETHYGSVDGFLKKGLGLTNKDLKKLQKAYLQ